MNDVDNSQQIYDFCSYSLQSSNPKTVFTAGVVMFNHSLTYKGDLSRLTTPMIGAIQAIVEALAVAFTDKGSTDSEAVNAIILAEIRMVFNNDHLTKKIQTDIKDKVLQVHN